ncbi:divergent polysaccharide deacetylase family protein [Erwinia endophytica]|uniref:divergent polysaccharide deacetylase family protein n=1 Tax=Erwinia endophytica TaxID=1563158 RepID=UPI001265F097|nr:divergent polysaccharide deacetylase family protein [Erwinia endophytica]KAB8310517.1 divergent polysaccharide deacetylase family protein [Erwinia endophytica]
MSHLRKISGMLTGLLIACSAYAGKLSIVIDDFGYRPTQENQVLQMPPAISVAVLPNAPHAREMATKAHQRGHEVLIHLPMAPISKQPLEKDTLTPDMPSSEIERIIREAVARVPYAVGLNNHMGSAMTSSLPGMQKVMQVLNHYNFYFLDSMTIGNSQSTRAAQGTSVKILKRRVFLDDTQNEADIRKQFIRAVRLAQRDGSAIAIGHPHPTTVKVLQQMLPTLPADIILVRPSQLLNEPQIISNKPLPPESKPTRARNPFRGVQICPVKVLPVPAIHALGVVADSITDSAGVRYIKTNFSGLTFTLGNTP